MRLAHRVSPEELSRAGVLVRVPAALRGLTDGQEEVLLEAADLKSLLAGLDHAVPGIRDRILDETGRMRPYVNVFVNDDLRRGAPAEVALKPGDVVHILPSVAGGWFG